MESLAGVMKGRNVYMDAKRGMSNNILLPTLTYGSDNWTWSRAQQSRVRAVEMSYLRGACGVNRWDGVINENVYKRCGMRGRGSGVGCSVVEWVNKSTLTWFGHIQSINQREHTPGRDVLHHQPYNAKPEGSSGQVSVQVPSPS